MRAVATSVSENHVIKANRLLRSQSSLLASLGIGSVSNNAPRLVKAGTASSTYWGFLVCEKEKTRTGRIAQTFKSVSHCFCSSVKPESGLNIQTPKADHGNARTKRLQESKRGEPTTAVLSLERND